MVVWRGFLRGGMVVMGFATLFACQSDPAAPEEEEGLRLQAAVVGATPSDEAVYRTPAPASGSPVGWSSVHRDRRGITMALDTDLLPAGHAATVWAVIFNNPAACAASPCESGDLATAAVLGSVLRAAGSVVGQNGVHFAGRISEGDASEALSGPGLIDAFGAEVHFLLRSHGPRVRGLVQDQTRTAGGGCDVFITPAMPTQRGECSDVAFSIHLP